MNTRWIQDYKPNTFTFSPFYVSETDMTDISMVFQIPAYDHTKHTILNAGWLEEGVPLHVVSSMVAGLMTAFTTSPIDVIKTRMMNQKGKSKQFRIILSAHSLCRCYKNMNDNQKGKSKQFRIILSAHSLCRCYKNMNDNQKGKRKQFIIILSAHSLCRCYKNTNDKVSIS